MCSHAEFQQEQTSQQWSRRLWHCAGLADQQSKSPQRSCQPISLPSSLRVEIINVQSCICNRNVSSPAVDGFTLRLGVDWQRFTSNWGGMDGRHQPATDGTSLRLRPLSAHWSALRSHWITDMKQNRKHSVCCTWPGNRICTEILKELHSSG